MRAIPLVLASLLLAGCTQLDDAKGELDEAREALASAQREAQEAKDRYDRVKSATIVRTERVQLNVSLHGNGTEAWFVANASRAGAPIPRENLTRAPLVEVAIGGARFACDPLSCRFGYDNEDDISIRWADGHGEAASTDVGVLCEPSDSYVRMCDVPALARADAEVVVTTAAGDVTS